MKSKRKKLPAMRRGAGPFGTGPLEEFLSHTSPRSTPPPPVYHTQETMKVRLLAINLHGAVRHSPASQRQDGPTRLPHRQHRPPTAITESSHQNSRHSATPPPTHRAQEKSKVGQLSANPQEIIRHPPVSWLDGVSRNQLSASPPVRTTPRGCPAVQSHRRGAQGGRHEATTEGHSWRGFGAPTAPRTLSKNLIRLFGENKVRRAS